MKTIFHIISLAVLLFAAFPTSAEAHRLQPAYLEISEQNPGTFNVLWKRPLVGNKPMNISPQLPGACSNLTEPVLRPSQSGAVERWLIDCGESGLANKTIVIDGLESTVTDTLIRIELADGSMHTTVLRPASPNFLVPEKPSKAKVAGSYLGLGVEHTCMLYKLATGRQRTQCLISVGLSYLLYMFEIYGK